MTAPRPQPTFRERADAAVQRLAMSIIQSAKESPEARRAARDHLTGESRMTQSELREMRRLADIMLADPAPPTASRLIDEGHKARHTFLDAVLRAGELDDDQRLDLARIARAVAAQAAYAASRLCPEAGELEDLPLLTAGVSAESARTPTATGCSRCREFTDEDLADLAQAILEDQGGA